MRAPRLLLPIAAVLLAAAAARAAPPPPEPASDPETARLRREVERLRRERDLASGKGFYLRLDAGRRRLALTLQGVALDDYAAEAVEWGVPEVLFVDRTPGPDWDLEAFSKGRLEPERERDRLEVVAPGAERLAGRGGGFALAAARCRRARRSPTRSRRPTGSSSPRASRSEVRAKGEGGRNRSAFQRFADAVSLRFADLGTALGFGAKERVRLRVTLEAEDAASLYRSLPPDVGLIVVGLPAR